LLIDDPVLQGSVTKMLKDALVFVDC